MAVSEIQYSTSSQFTRSKADDNVSGLIDQKRIAAYDLYDGLYHNRQESLKVSIRGVAGQEDSDAAAIYLPSSKKIIEATQRYLCVGFDYYAQQQGVDDGDNSQVNADTVGAGTQVDTYYADFFKREKIKSKFANQKRYCLIRGDALWYITADPNKEEGKRLSLTELDPRHYFPIDDPEDNTRIIGCHIVDVVQDPRSKDDKNKLVARRQTYRKEYNPDGSFRAITSERSLYEIGKWDDRNLQEDQIKLVEVVDPKQDLPKQITQIPVYHIKNNCLPNAGFGLSELAGMETLIFALNQSVSDEDLTMVMQGLGMYKTNAAPPTNSDGSEGDWNVGPGQVIEVGLDQFFDRVTGVSDLSPYQDHMKLLDDSLQQGTGTPEIAVGAVDVAIAESGIALLLQMGPILAKNAEKELEWILLHDQMFYDLTNMWLPAYEGIQPNGVKVLSIVDDPMPVNRDAKVQELILLYTSGVISLGMVVQGLMDIGYKFPSDDPEEAAALIAAEQKQKSIDMMGDPYSDGSGGIGDDFGDESGGANGQIDAGVT